MMTIIRDAYPEVSVRGIRGALQYSYERSMAFKKVADKDPYKFLYLHYVCIKKQTYEQARGKLESKETRSPGCTNSHIRRQQYADLGNAILGSLAVVVFPFILLDTLEKMYPLEKLKNRGVRALIYCFGKNNLSVSWTLALTLSAVFLCKDRYETLRIKRGKDTVESIKLLITWSPGHEKDSMLRRDPFTGPARQIALETQCEIKSQAVELQTQDPDWWRLHYGV